MKNRIDLSAFLSEATGDMPRQRYLFAVLNLGIVELLANGLLTPTDATRLFFNAINCQFVRKNLHDKIADKIMSHGVQLADLFEALPKREAQQEFQRELDGMRSLCFRLLKEQKVVA